jgi:4-hydroxy-tetrahydrodipicolinate synthase
VEALGADGILSVTPYYNKPTQEGLVLHYKAIANAISLPIIVYSVAGRTGVNVEPSTVKRLAEIDNIVGVKEASGMLGQMTRIRALTPDLALLSGDDILTSAVLGIGGKGVISVASNVVPKEMSQLAETNDIAITTRLAGLMDVLFIESNPIPVKAAMAMMGLLEPVWRLPMCSPTPASEAKIRQTLQDLGLVNA